MQSYVATFLDVRKDEQERASGYRTAVGTVDAICRHLTANEFEVLVATLPVNDESIENLQSAGYQVL